MFFALLQLLACADLAEQILHDQEQRDAEYACLLEAVDADGFPPLTDEELAMIEDTRRRFAARGFAMPSPITTQVRKAGAL